MATEDIRVEHSASAETASFDIKDRCLILPVWKDMSNSMYDMLVAHEVSHALHTPFSEWEEAKKGISNAATFMQICNVVEDARIERKIKQQYAGIRKDFARAYNEINDLDMFEIKGKDISSMNLIDRLNIEFKLGLFGLVQVPFSAEEQKIVTRMANTDTFAEVVELAKELLDDFNQEQEDQNSAEQSQSGQNSEDGAEQSQSGEESQDGSDGSDSSNGSQDGSDDSDGSDGSDGSQDGEDGSQDGSESQDGSDGQKSNNQDSESSDGEEHSSYDYDDYTNNSGHQVASKTQQAFEQGKKNLTDTNAKSRRYYTLPTSMNIDKIIVDYKEVNKIWEDHTAKLSENQSEYYDRHIQKTNEIIEECNSFLTSKKAVVNHMVSQFQMKQSADEDRRTSISKSGVLDTTAMINYKWSEDVFQSNQIVSDGKNHGMIFFLDWSGSMSRILQDTVEQMLILTEFCNKVNIPFEVYAFSDRNDILSDDARKSFDEETNTHTHPQWNGEASNQLKPHDFSLINFISSRMNKKEYKDAVSKLYILASGRCYYSSLPSKFNLGCTPLNESVISAMDIVPAFQEATGVQIVNTVFLTDGQGHGMGLSCYPSQGFVHDPVTRKDYRVGENKETDLYLKILKERTGCNIIGIYLHNSKTVANLRYTYLTQDDIGPATKSFKASNYAIASSGKTGYDECYIIKAKIEEKSDALESLDSDASYSKIRNAFKKNANGNKTNKIIATKMIEVFASTLIN